MLAEEVATSLASYGLAGAILAGLVAPLVWFLVKGSQKREDDRAAIDREENKERNARAERMLQALETTVKNQSVAMEEWRRYAAEESLTHTSIIRGIDRLVTKIAP